MQVALQSYTSSPLPSLEIKVVCLIWAALIFEIYCFHVALGKEKADNRKPAFVRVKEWMLPLMNTVWYLYLEFIWICCISTGWQSL